MSLIKKIGIVLIVVVFILSLSNNGCQRRDLIDLTERMTTIRVANTQLLTSIENKDAKLVLSDAEIIKLKNKNTKLEGENKDLKARERRLEESLATISASVDSIPPDSSYAFITSLYDYEGELIYPFNEKQVKEIHVTYLEKMTLLDLTVNLQKQITNLSYQLQFSDAINRKLLEQVEIYKSKEGDYKKIISNKDEEINLQEKQVKKEKRKTIFFKITTGIAAGLAILIAL